MGKRYKIVIEEGNRLSFYSTDKYDEGKEFFSFTDQFGFFIRVNKKNIIKIIDYGKEGENETKTKHK